MTRTRRGVVIPAAVAAALLAACGPQRIAGTTRPDDERIVLLADAETGAVERATVSNNAGSVGLDSAREATAVAPNQPPGEPGTLSDPEIARLLGEALYALPPAARHFTLNFQFESDELTDESRALVPEVLKAVRGRPVPDLVVVGHTD